MEITRFERNKRILAASILFLILAVGIRRDDKVYYQCFYDAYLTAYLNGKEPDGLDRVCDLMQKDGYRDSEIISVAIKAANGVAQKKFSFGEKVKIFFAHMFSE